MTDTELFQVTERCAMLIGQVLEFENEVDGNVETCSNLVNTFCNKLVEGEKAGRGRVTTRVLYDMFQTCTFPAKSKGKNIATVVLKALFYTNSFSRDRLHSQN